MKQFIFNIATRLLHYLFPPEPENLSKTPKTDKFVPKAFPTSVFEANHFPEKPLAYVPFLKGERAILRCKGHSPKIKTLRSAIQRQYKEIPDTAERLFNAKWLSDTHINDYLTNLLSASPTTLALASNYTQSQNFTKELATSPNRKHFRQKLQGATTILWPICQDNHWYLLVLTKNKDHCYSIFCLDGLNRFGAHIKLFKLAKDLISALSPFVKKPTTSKKSIQIPPQSNSEDCGVVACFWAKAYFEHNASQLQQYIKDGQNWNYSPFRKEIAKTMIKKPSLRR